MKDLMSCTLREVSIRVWYYYVPEAKIKRASANLGKIDSEVLSSIYPQEKIPRFGEGTSLEHLQNFIDSYRERVLSKVDLIFESGIVFENSSLGKLNLQYPQYIPSKESYRRFFQEKVEDILSAKQVIEFIKYVNFAYTLSYHWENNTIENLLENLYYGCSKTNNPSDEYTLPKCAPYIKIY